MMAGGEGAVRLRRWSLSLAIAGLASPGDARLYRRKYVVQVAKALANSPGGLGLGGGGGGGNGICCPEHLPAVLVSPLSNQGGVPCRSLYLEPGAMLHSGNLY
jgi:hypothetical protein